MIADRLFSVALAIIAAFLIGTGAKSLLVGIGVFNLFTAIVIAIRAN